MFKHKFPPFRCIFVNCTQLHLFESFRYFDESRHPDHFCQLHPLAPNCTFLRFSGISTNLVILIIFANCTQLHLFEIFRYFDKSRRHSRTQSSPIYSIFLLEMLSWTYCLGINWFTASSTCDRTSINWPHRWLGNVHGHDIRFFFGACNV